MAKGKKAPRLDLYFLGKRKFKPTFPDETTICRFRNGLIKLNVLNKLLDMINSQIGKKGLLVREGAVVDASVAESRRKPRKVIDIMPEDRAEEGDNSDGAPQDEPSVTISYSDIL